MELSQQGEMKLPQRTDAFALGGERLNFRSPHVKVSI